MEALLWFVWAAVALTAAMGILILTGKGDFLVFGRRMVKEDYHVGRVRLVYGVWMILVAGLLAAVALFYKSLPYGFARWLMLPVFLLSIVVWVFRRFWCSK